MARAHGARSQMAFAFETVYGTAPGSGYARLPFASKTLSAAQPLVESDLLGYGRDPLAPIKDAVTVDGDLVIPMCARSIGFWLKLAFGAPTTTGSDPYEHVFTSGGWVLPSAAIEFGMPEVPQYSMFTGVRLDRLSFTMQRAGQLTANASLIAQQEENEATAQTGSLAAVPLQRFGHWNGSILRAGSALGNVVSAEVTYSNGLDRIETIRDDGAIDGVDAGMASLQGRMDVRFADTTLLDQAINGTPAEFKFAWSLGAGVGLEFVAHAVYLPVPRREIAGPQGVQATFEWQAALATSPERMCTVTLENDVDGY